MDPRERFDDTVADYRRYRPDYPAALFDWIGRQCGLEEGSVVIDIGCGTGISSRQLAERGWRVIGADPNEAMLDAARDEGGTFDRGTVEYTLTDAEALRLPVDRADAIVGGQAFHWLDLERALPRFAELLGPEGPVVAFWNLRAAGEPLMDDYETLLHDWSTEYASVGAEPRAEAVARQVPVQARAFFPHEQILDRAGFHGRVWSASYVKNVVTERDRFDAELDRLFDAHEEDGEVRFSYRTMAIRFPPRMAES